MEVDINNLLGSENMAKLKQFKKDKKSIIIYTPTEEHAYTLLAFLYTLGYQFGASSTFNGVTDYETYKKETVYFMGSGKHISYGPRDYAETESAHKNTARIKLS